MDLMSKLAKAAENNPALKTELTAIGDKIVEVAKKYPLDLSAEEASAVAGGLCVFTGSGDSWCIFHGR